MLGDAYAEVLAGSAKPRQNGSNVGGGMVETRRDVRLKPRICVLVNWICDRRWWYDLRGVGRAWCTRCVREIHVQKRFHKALMKPSRHWKTQMGWWSGVHCWTHSSTVWTMQRLGWRQNQELVQAAGDFVNLRGNYKVLTQSFDRMFKMFFHAPHARLEIRLSDCCRVTNI